jgi:hypothetical protein
MAGGVLLLGLYAAGEDDYYGDGTTRWGHAARSGGSVFLSALFAVPTLIAGLFIVLALLRKRPSPLWVIPLCAVYVISLLYALVALSLGH